MVDSVLPLRGHVVKRYPQFSIDMIISQWEFFFSVCIGIDGFSLLGDFDEIIGDFDEASVVAEKQLG